MANIPSDLLYTPEHEYLRDLGDGIEGEGIVSEAKRRLHDAGVLRPGGRAQRAAPSGDGIPGNDGGMTGELPVPSLTHPLGRAIVS